MKISKQFATNLENDFLQGFFFFGALSVQLLFVDAILLFALFVGILKSFGETITLYPSESGNLTECYPG